MLRDDRRGDHRRDEKKDHKDRDRKRKHEAPTLLILFNIFFAQVFWMSLGKHSVFPSQLLKCNAMLRWKGRVPMTTGRPSCEKFRCSFTTFGFCSQLGANHLISLKCGQ